MMDDVLRAIERQTELQWNAMFCIVAAILFGTHKDTPPDPVYTFEYAAKDARELVRQVLNEVDP